MADLNTHDADAVTGAVYFVVGRGTEGGASAYHLTIAGITSGTHDPGWGDASKVAANSGYSLGTIQVDLGQRGTWALGSTDGAAPKPGQTTYVDGIVDQAAQYAKSHQLKFTSDTAQLRSDLLSHGDGTQHRGTITFIDKDTRDSINAWASSPDGQKWIHENMDYPQVKAATTSAMAMVDTYGKNIPEDRRLETIAILAKTENQMPSQMKAFEKVLKDGGNYDDVLAKAQDIKKHYGYYAGAKAATIAEEYKDAFKDPEKANALNRAQAKVGSASFDPSASDADIKEALKAIGQGTRAHAHSPSASGSLQQGAHGDKVTALQTDLAKLGITDGHGHALRPDGDFGAGTKAAVEKFQRAHDLKADGVVGAKTLDALKHAAHPPQLSLADSHNPGNAMYNQALQNVRAIDAARGRASDQFTNNFAGSLATAAHAEGLSRIDHVVLSDDGKRAFAVQGDLNSPFKRIATVDVAQAVAKPLEQSSTEFQQLAQQPPQPTMAPPSLPTPSPQHEQPAMPR